MIWMKAWLETRARVLLVLFMMLICCGFEWGLANRVIHRVQEKGVVAQTPGLFHTMTIGFPAGSLQFANAAWLNLYIQVAGFMIVICALIMAGAGLNTQTAHGLYQGIHPSMYYTLSLPVSRRKWLASRALVGWVEMMALASIPFFAPLREGFAWRELFRFYPFVLAGTAVFYAISLVLSAIFDELWQGLIAMAVVGAFAGWAMVEGWAGLDVFRWMSGDDVLNHGSPALPGFLLCAAVSAALVWITIWIVERKEF